MIRLAEEKDLARCYEIYEEAKKFMRASGNMKQWAGNYPGDMLTKDVELQRLFVMEENGKIGACFVFIIGADPTYALIENGEWKYDSPYGTIHRLATDGSIKNCMHKCTEFCLTKIRHLRVDTHEDNKPMQEAAKREGFEYCGIIYVADGTPRLAYEMVK